MLDSGGSDYFLGFPLLGYQRREFTGPYMLGFGATYRWKMKEYQLKAVKAVYLNLAAQAANVWTTRDSMSLNDLRDGNRSPCRHDHRTDTAGFWFRRTEPVFSLFFGGV